MPQITRGIEFLDSRVRIWTDEGMQEVFCTREEFGGWIEKKSAEVTSEHILALHLLEHKKTDPDLQQLEKLKNKDLSIELKNTARATR